MKYELSVHGYESALVQVFFVYILYFASLTDGLSQLSGQQHLEFSSLSAPPPSPHSNVCKFLLAQTPEVGARNIVYGCLTQTSQGAYIASCKEEE